MKIGYARVTLPIGIAIPQVKQMIECELIDVPTETARAAKHLCGLLAILTVIGLQPLGFIIEPALETEFSAAALPSEVAEDGHAVRCRHSKSIYGDGRRKRAVNRHDQGP